MKLKISNFEKIMKNGKNQQYYSKNMENKFSKYIINKIIKVGKELGINEISKIDKLHDIFVHSCISGCSFEESRKYITGNGDGGVDSWWINEKEKKLILIQTKLQKISNQAISEIKENYRKYFQQDQPIPEDKKSLKKIKKIYEEKRLKKVEYIGVEPNNDKNEVIDEKSKIIGWKKLLIDTVTNIDKNITLKFDELLDKTGYSKVELDNQNTIMVSVSVGELVSKISKYNEISQETIFRANVRNKVFTKSFKDGFHEVLNNEPENFQIFNNGITMTVRDIDLTTKDLMLTNPQIVNGQQTTRTLIEIYDKNKKKISKNAKIFIKIIKSEDDELTMKIAKYANKQQKITPGDLVSTTYEFKKLNDKAISQQLYISAKKGKSEIKNIYKKMDLKVVLIDDLIKVFITQKMPEKMGNLKNSIGTVKANFIEKKYFSEIEPENIKNAFDLIKIKNKYTKHFKEKTLIEFKNKAKEKNKVWSYAEIAIYRMIILGIKKEKIYSKLCNYRDEYKKDSLIQSFKKQEAYKKLDII